MIKIILLFALIIGVIYVFFVPVFDNLTSHNSQRLPAAIAIEDAGNKIYEAVVNWLNEDPNKGTVDEIENMNNEANP